MRILVVEDERPLARSLARGLSEEGHAVDTAHSLRRAGDLAVANAYDLIVLDLQLPDGSGLDLLRSVRQAGSSVAVLILSARDRVEQRVEGLNAGADDYLTKPFSFAELLARIGALDRRRTVPLRDRLRMGRIEVDRTAREIRVDGGRLTLTPREFALAEYFLLHPRVVLTRSRIASDLWEDEGGTASNVIDVLLSRLRRKVAAAGAELPIRSITNVGWILDEGGES